MTRSRLIVAAVWDDEPRNAWGLAIPSFIDRPFGCPPDDFSKEQNDGKAQEGRQRHAGRTEDRP